MIKEIIHDKKFLSQPSEDATIDDMQIAKDLLDTLKYNKQKCVGMAANMIGVKKRIIVFSTGANNVVMFNPVIINQMDSFETDEGCLSLNDKIRHVTRYQKIEVEFMDNKFKRKKKFFTGFTAQIIQHEIDHCNGILI